VRFQSENYNCGAASLVNALLSLGLRVDEPEAERLCRTDESGTDEYGIARALKILGYTYEELDCRSLKESWTWLVNQLELGRPVIVCVDNFSHWATVIGMLGHERVVYCDPQKTAENKRENGVRLMTMRAMGRRWGKSCGRGVKRRFYGIAVIDPQE
jgi:ABC-type bacteriocin/lantibiotic exporter with double-glycine peptidase domain